MSLPLQLFSWNAWAPWLIRKASFWLFKSRITQRKKDDDNDSDQDDQDDQGGDGDDDDNNDDDDRHDDDHDDFDTDDDDMNKQKLKHVVPGTNDKNKNNNRSTPAAHPGREALGFVAIDGTIFKVIILSVARWSPDTSLSWSLTGKYRSIELFHHLHLVGRTDISAYVYIKIYIPSRKLTYPPKIAFWRWFSFSQGGIC